MSNESVTEHESHQKVQVQTWRNKAVQAVKGSALIKEYQKLNEKDKRALFALGVFVFILISYFGVWRPLDQSFMKAEQNYQEQLRALDWLQKNLPLQSAGKVELNQSLTAFIVSSAKPHRIVLSSLQPEGDQSVAVVLESVSFQSLLTWLDKIAPRVSIKQVTLNRTNAEGVVNAHITFTRI